MESQNVRFIQQTITEMKVSLWILIQTGITCKKTSCYMRNSACNWLIVKNTKIFQSYVKAFAKADTSVSFL